MKKHSLATGYLIVDDYEKGQLETLSIGDYGKSENIKADFLGFDRELNGVNNGPCKPLSEKWVVTLSTQYGCSMNCTFCDVPKIKFRGNVSFEDLLKQLYTALAAFPTVKYTDRLNIHFARMGDPIYNEDVLSFTRWLYECKQNFQEETGVRFEVIHPVLTTSMPAIKQVRQRLKDWCFIKNEVYNGQAGLQLSINSTNEDQRKIMFNNRAMTLDDIAFISKTLPPPISRKYCLNFAYASDFEVDAKKIARLFDPEKFMCKITPIHENNACAENGIKTVDGYESFAPYQPVEEALKAEGFDVIVFIPSMDEEKGLVTCGNAVLSGRQPEEKPVNIMGLK